MTTAAQAFYDFSQDKAVREECRRSGSGLHLHAIITAVFDAASKMTREQHSRALGDGTKGTVPVKDYRWNNFEFMCHQLIRHMQYKTAYPDAVKYWPLLEKLMALPAFGWNFYERMLNEAYGRQELLAEREVPSSYKFIFDVEGSMDVVFWTRVDGGYYMERIPVSLPKTDFATWGEELQALAKVLTLAGQKAKASYKRTEKYYQYYTGPKNMRTKAEPEKVYKTAKVRPAKHDDAAVLEKMLLKELLADVKHRFSKEEKALLKKYPAQVSGALGLSM
jgi:hypothetical protein